MSCENGARRARHAGAGSRSRTHASASPLCYRCRDEIANKEDPFGPIDPLSYLSADSKERWALGEARTETYRIIDQLEALEGERAIKSMLRNAETLRRRLKEEDDR
jgi:hypothetical protein